MPTSEQSEQVEREHQQGWRVQVAAESAAFQAGYRAAQDGEPVEMCPYTRNEYAMKWHDGWCAATEDRACEERDANP